MAKALVVLSGGQDSTTCLYWALQRFGRENVQTLTFDYGQRHRVELASAKKVAAIAGVANTLLPINTFAALGQNALVDEAIEVSQAVDTQTGLPNTFVPGRNLIFLTYAAAFAYPLGIQEIVLGVAQTDYSGYPDCREQTILALEKAINLGMERQFAIYAPLMYKSKQETVAMARQLGALEALAWSHTCYNGVQPPCGECPACQLRAKGFAEAGEIDPLLQRLGVA